MASGGEREENLPGAERTVLAAPLDLTHGRRCVYIRFATPL